MAAQHNASSRTRTNLLQRKQGWYARYYVPKHQQPAYGRAEVQRTLGTRDKLEAHRRLPAVLTDIQREVDEAVSGSLPVDFGNAADVLRELDTIHTRARLGQYPEPEAPGQFALVDVHLDELFEAHARRTGAVDYEGEPDPSKLSPVVRERFSQVRMATSDPDYRPLSDWSDDFIKHLKAKRVKDGTWKTHQRRLNHFVLWAGSKRDPRHMKDGDAVSYRDHLNASSELSTRVRKDTARTVRALFEWLRKDRKLFRYNPFADLGESILSNPNDPDDDGRRAWHAEELVTFIDRLNPARPLWSIFVIALYSGLRINEVCSMRLAHVARGCLRVAPEFAKNDNSIRVVPIHPVIAPLVAKLVETSFDDYLISGLVPGGQDKRRGAYPSKRFSEHRKTLGLSDPDTTFHSTRHNFATAAERAGVSVPTFQKLLGHARQSITLDRYSDGPELASLRDAVARITYDRAKTEDHQAVTVDGRIAPLLAGFEGNKTWRRKHGRDLVPASCT